MRRQPDKRLGGEMARLANRRSRSGELPEEGSGLLHIGGVNALGEPVVNRGQQLAGSRFLARAPPRPARSHGRPQLSGFCPLPARHGKT
jgi:hypothetical protein